MNIDTDQRYGAWTGAQLEAFLDATRVPLRLAVETAQGPLIVPVCFEYLRGCLWAASPADSLLVTSLEQAPNVAFDVSTNEVPYRGVRGRATVAVKRDGEAVLERLLDRYIGRDAPLARRLLARQDAESALCLRISWLTSWDFSERMSGIAPVAQRHGRGAI